MRRTFLGLAFVALAASLAWGVTRDERAFPHEKHVRVFPTCFGCHDGVRTADASKLFPDPQACASCHDGTQLKRVAWSGPSRRATNLRFTHQQHQREAGFGTGTSECQACHRVPGRTEFMAVQRAVPANCISCHEGPRQAHQASAHLAADSPCATCHVPVTRAAALTADRIAAFPKPPSHERRDFIQSHAPGTKDNTQSCATCHARESCERCHVNADKVQPIAALGNDARVASLVKGRAPSYPEPASHRDPDFVTAHGGAARTSPATCANCHAQPSSKSCHTGRGAEKVIAQLPMPKRGGARGVELVRRTDWSLSQAGPQGTPAATPARTVRNDGRRPIEEALADTGAARHFVRVHPAGYDKAHEVDASTKRLDCASCHAKRFCADCHQGEGRRRYHPANFVQRHPADVYGRNQTCASCHNTEVFCKSCHERSGLGSKGALNTSYHNAQPNWLLQHARAARQELTSCTTCHQQRDCMRCHSQAGWGVNPHGPGFNAESMSKRNRQMCLACHFTDPLQKQ
jgi:hypothetical protein